MNHRADKRSKGTKESSPAMNIGPGVRAAIVAGVSAGITVSLMLMGEHGSVTVHNTATDAPVDETTLTTAADTTSTTPAPTTTTSAAPATTTTTLSMEQRLARIEATTTTTTIAKSVAPTVYMPSFNAGQVTLSILFKNHHDARSRSMFPNPAVRISVTLADGSTSEIVTPLPATEEGTMSVPIPEGVTAAHVVDTEWTGGILPTGAGSFEK
jgi:hypothetical protein